MRCATAVAEVGARRGTLVQVPGTTTARFVSRAAGLFQVPLLNVCVPSVDSGGVTDWLRRIWRTEDPLGSAATCVLVSPPRNRLTGHSIPWPDQALSVVSDRSIVLHARQGGNVERLLRWQLSDENRRPERIRLCVHTGRIPVKLRDAWLTAGMVAWHLDAPPPRADVPPVVDAPPAAILDWSEFQRAVSQPAAAVVGPLHAGPAWPLARRNRGSVLGPSAVADRHRGKLPFLDAPQNRRQPEVIGHGWHDSGRVRDRQLFRRAAGRSVAATRLSIASRGLGF